MPLDPSIIMSGQKSLSDLATSVGNAPAEIAQARMLRAQSTMQQQALGEQQALKAAYASAATKDADGNVSIDQGKLLSNIGSNPLIAYKQPEISQQLAQNQMAIQKAKIDQGLAYAKVGAQFLGGAKSQKGYDTGIAHMKALNLPTSQFEGKTWTPQLSQQIVNDSQDYQERLANKFKQQSADAETLKAKAAAVEAGLPVGPMGGAPGGKAGGGGPQGAGGGSAPGAPYPGFNPPPKMQMKALEDYNQAVESSRQAPDAAQELKNVMFAKNLHEITKIAPNGDLNKLNPQQTKLAITELVKMAGGSVPTEGELEQMTPNTYAQRYAGLLQNFTGKSQPANAGEFIQQALDYADGIGKVSSESLAKREGQIADRFRPWLGEGQHKLLKAQTAERYGDQAKSAQQEYPVGTTAKTKSGTPVIYKGNGVWQPQ